MVKARLILPDTNIFIYALDKKEPYAYALRVLIEKQQLVISAVVAAEFLVSATKLEHHAFSLLMDEFSVLSVDRKVAEKAAEIRKTALSRKTKTHLADCLIAAQCAVFGFVLATKNPKDYPKSGIEIFSFKQTKTWLTSKIP